MVSRSQVVDAAKDLNQVLQLRPPIDLKLPVGELKDMVIQAVELINPNDTLEEGTRLVIQSLTSGGTEVQGENKGEGEVKAETEGETGIQTAPTPANGEDQVVVGEETVEAAPSTANGKKKIGGARYAGSTTEKMDKALEKGGTWKELAESLGTSVGRLRGHAKFRVAKGYFTMVGDDEKVKLTKTANFE